MDYIQRYQDIDLMSLDQAQYFKSLLEKAYEKGLLSQERFEGLQLELIELLGKLVERYTNGESSSVPVEKAQQILLSVSYCIGLFLKTDKVLEEQINLLKSMKISELFYQGMDTVAILKNSAATLYEALLKNRRDYNNISYQTTIQKGIQLFFHSYEIEFEAHEIPCDIDYQLCIPLGNLPGVEWMQEYLRRLTLENDFTMHYPVEEINQLLYSFHKDSEHMLINIFELVLTNALGRSMAQLPVDELNITAEDCIWLQQHLHPLSKAELRKRLDDAREDIMNKVKLDKDISAYAKEAIPQLTDRIRHNLETKTLKEIFITLEYESGRQEVFIDGPMMEDEKLRELIKELEGLGSVSDKMNRIREVVRSFRDLIELLEECFYENDYEEVFRCFTAKEMDMMHQIMIEEAGIEYDEDYIPPMQWQRVLHHTIRTKRNNK